MEPAVAAVEVREERYDAPVAVDLVRRLWADLDERYGEEEDGGEGWFGEVTPPAVAPPAGTFLVAWLDGETGLEQPEAMALHDAEGFALIPAYGRYRDDPRSRCYERLL
jgi:hypothetical protein